MSEGFNPDHDTIDADKIREHDGTQSPWVKTSDRLPEAGDDVVMYWRGIRMWSACTVTQSILDMSFSCAYWMPIPPVPKEEQDGEST